MRGPKAFLSDRSGNFAMLSAALSVPLVLAVGLAVDYSRYVASSQHLQELADITSLTLAASNEQNGEHLETLAHHTINHNLNPTRLDSVRILSIKTTDDDVDVALTGEIPATFMSIAGYEMLPSRASALAERAVKGNVEVALVLDNTWSMSDTDHRGVSKIDTLKKAASGLVDKLLQTDDGSVRIGLVPYADYVNVGTQHRNESWLDVPADYTTTPSPRTCEMRTTRTVCDKERPTTTCTRVVDGITETYSCGGGCEPGYSRTVTVDPYEVCWGGGSGTAHTWHGCVGSRIGSDFRLHDRNPSVRYPGYVAANYLCPNPIVTLTSNKRTLLKAVDDMVIRRGSYRPETYIPAGLIWGLNVLNPTAPFRDAGEYDEQNLKPRKVAVLMTDGHNTLYYRSGDGRHVEPSGGEASRKSQIDQTNADTVAICNHMKAQKIEIYTVAFMVSDPAAKTMLENCATDPSYYYDATDSASLLLAFEGISSSLSVVRLAR